MKRYHTFMYPKEFITNPLPYKSIHIEDPISYVSDNGFQRTVYQSANGHILGGMNGRLLLCAFYTYLIKEQTTTLNFQSLKEILESVGIWYNSRECNKLRQALMAFVGTNLAVIKKDWKTGIISQENVVLSKNLLYDPSTQGKRLIDNEEKEILVGGRIEIQMQVDPYFLKKTIPIPIQEDIFEQLRKRKSPLLFDLYLYVELKKKSQNSLLGYQQEFIEWEWLYKQFHGKRFSRLRDFKVRIKKALHKISEIRGDLRIEFTESQIIITYYDLPDIEE